MSESTAPLSVYAIAPVDESVVIGHEFDPGRPEVLQRTVVRAPGRAESLVLTQAGRRADELDIVEDIALWAVLALPSDLVRELGSVPDAGEAAQVLADRAAGAEQPWTTLQLMVDGARREFVSLAADLVTIYVSTDSSLPVAVVDRNVDGSRPEPEIVLIGT